MYEQGLQTGVELGPVRQSGLKQWATAGSRLHSEQRGMPGALNRSTGERQAGHVGVLYVMREPQQRRQIRWGTLFGA